MIRFFHLRSITNFIFLLIQLPTKLKLPMKTTSVIPEETVVTPRIKFMKILVASPKHSVSSPTRVAELDSQTSELLAPATRTSQPSNTSRKELSLGSIVKTTRSTESQIKAAYNSLISQKKRPKFDLDDFELKFLTNKIPSSPKKSDMKFLGVSCFAFSENMTYLAFGAGYDILLLDEKTMETIHRFDRVHQGKS